MVKIGVWVVFLGTAIACNFAFWPDFLSILVKIIPGGNSLDALSNFGECMGVLAHIAIITLGYSAILVTSTLSLNVIKYLSVGSVFYLTYQAFRSYEQQYTVNVNGKVMKSRYCNGQLKLTTDLYSSQYLFSDSLGAKPTLWL